MTYLDERAKWEKDYWTRLVARCRGKIAQIAQESGCHRSSIYKTLERLELRPARKPGRGGNAVWRGLEDR